MMSSSRMSDTRPKIHSFADCPIQSRLQAQLLIAFTPEEYVLSTSNAIVIDDLTNQVRVVKVVFDHNKCLRFRIAFTANGKR